MTLLISALTLLLSVGVARAEGWHNAPTVKDPSDWVIAWQPTGEVIAICEETTNNCTIVKPEKFTCYQKMQEVIGRMKSRMHANQNSRSLTRGFVMTEEDWAREVEPIYQECVK